MARITFIARMTVKPGREREFVSLCRELERHAKAHEAGTLLYQFFKLREPGRYAVLESFRDEVAEQAHMGSASLAEIGPKLAACLDGTWVREYFDPLD